MAERAPVRLWLLRGLFAGIVVLILLRALLPLDVGAPRVPGPDLILCFVLAWVQRRPDVLTAPLIAGMLLLADFLLMRPPGLWALIVLVGSEVLRRRAYRTERTPALVEMAVVTVLIATMMIAQRLILTVLFVDQPPVTSELLHFLTTVAAYPIVAALSVYVFGIRARLGDEGGLRV